MRVKMRVKMSVNLLLWRFLYKITNVSDTTIGEIVTFKQEDLLMKLELTWIGKNENAKIESRIFILNFVYKERIA